MLSAGMPTQLCFSGWVLHSIINPNTQLHEVQAAVWPSSKFRPSWHPLNKIAVLCAAVGL
jgi:hypothetical protein